MKHRTLRTVAALALLSLFSSVSQGAPQSKYDEFVGKFRQALGINAKDEMAKLVKIYQAEAVVHADVLCSQLPTGTSEQLEKEIDALNKAWQTSLKTKFVEHHYTWLSLMNPSTYRERDRLQKSYNANLNKFVENQNGPKDGPTFEILGGEMRALAGAFEELGDGFQAGSAWQVYGLCYVETNRGKKGENPKNVVEGYGKMIENWDRIGLQHNRYHEIKIVYDDLIAKGWGAVLENPDGPVPGQPVATSEAVPIELTFEALGKLDQFQRPSFFVDEMYQIWPSLYFQGKNATASIPSMEQGPLVLRSSSSVLEVDFDRDGNGEEQIKLTGKLTPVEVELSDAGPKRKWAFLTAIGLEQDKYQGLQVNLQPLDEQMSLFYINAASMIGVLGETPVRVLDDNMDGIYGSEPKAYAYAGLTEGFYQPNMDAMVIGESKRALPWSEFQRVGEQWYKFESVNFGTSLSATPMELETGTLVLDYDGPPVNWMVVRGEATLENSFFDLMANGKKGIEVPVGSYELFVGEVRKGKKQQVLKALVLPGENTPSWTVQAGVETVVKLGEPFDFEFSAQRGEEEMIVSGKSVTIVGSAGERYERTWGCRPQPEASARKAGSRRGGKAERMDVVMDMNEQENGVQKYNYDDTWRPLDTPLEIKSGEDTWEIQLIDKKNKLFGKIESTWK